MGGLFDCDERAGIPSWNGPGLRGESIVPGWIDEGRHTKLTDLKARAVALGISVQSYVATGIPSEEVSAIARTQEAELIMVGTRGKTGLDTSCWEVRPSESFGWCPAPC